ncbi:hypothetical protein ANCCAN_02054 [Ancylostoma caninum]|uniref:Uncharacterized protein n=1 Tax=Ancylostoma caninum TaxID=29170 RepID=A0A368H8U8_ANCCA|nr:hypothetical protein ANCCAN_02054 [Ancylostoma caninum]
MGNRQPITLGLPLGCLSYNMGRQLSSFGRFFGSRLGHPSSAGLRGGLLRALNIVNNFQKEPSVIVTLGIGHDTAAEEALLKVLDLSLYNRLCIFSYYI